MTTAREAIKAVRAITGGPVYLDHTGGNCGALRADLEAGAFLLITDEDVLTYSAGEGQQLTGGTFVGLYSEDEDDSPRFLSDDDSDPTPEQIATLVRRVLAGEGHR